MTPVYYGISKKSVVGRTLYEGNRGQIISKKYKIHPDIFTDKRVVLIDEAIFSGKTLEYLAKNIREIAKPKTLDVKIITPPITRECEMLPRDITDDYKSILKYVDGIEFLDADIFREVMKNCCTRCL